MNFLKRKVKNPKKVFIGVVATLVTIVFWAFILVNYRNEIWPTKEVLFNQKRTYGRLRADLLKAQNLDAKYAEEKDKVAEKLKTFYLTDGATQADTYFRQRIEHAAKFSNLTLKSMSTIKRKDIKGAGIFSLEVNISSEGEFEKIVTFLQELDKKKDVEIYWVNCSLRPVRVKKEEQINLSGVLRVLCTDGELLKAQVNAKKVNNTEKINDSEKVNDTEKVNKTRNINKDGKVNKTRKRKVNKAKKVNEAEKANKGHIAG